MRRLGRILVHRTYAGDTLWAVWHEGGAWERQLNRRASARTPQRAALARAEHVARTRPRRAPARKKTRRRTSSTPPLFGTIALAIVVAILIVSLLWGCRFNA